MSHDTPSATRRAASRVLACPVDVAAIALYLLVATDVLTDTTSPATTRFALGVPLLVFLPGYVVVAGLFPHAAERGLSLRSADASGPPAPTGFERAALSFGISVALLPLYALLVAVSRYSYRSPAVLLGLVTFVGAGALWSAVRRGRLPPEDRFVVSVGRGFASLSRFLRDSGGLVTTVANAVLLVSVLVSVLGLGYALAAPPDGQSYTGFEVLTENEDGEYAAASFSSDLPAGAEQDLAVVVENREREETRYTVVAMIERIEVDNGSTTVIERERLDEFEETVDAGENWREEHTVSLETVGEDLRLSYYLYRGDPPERVDEATAYRYAYVWVDVVDDSAADSDGSDAGDDE
jgi:uncharacterized membrane protein